ncbi:MAG: regulatory protein NosR [Alphaproteobacteria bacterium HGW-Alphaproteobacteria-1]|jgi:NosR/NirI family nitrous oxide reductase transcriptional regulator|nr:MAG: regulatory protein NosR [Alphaproteobacteria bacterium HGW-Alphaproteobacteria-1]
MHRLAFLLIVLIGLALPRAALAQTDHRLLTRFLAEVPASELFEGADGYGAPLPDLAAAPVLRGGETVGYAFVNSDFVGTTGYSGKPIHILIALDEAAVVQGVRLMQHSEPIVLIGIPEARIAKLTAGFKGRDIAAEARGEAEHPLEIISGVTVTIMVIDDSILRSSLRVARALDLGGLGQTAVPEAPRVEIDPEAEVAGDWETLAGDGTVRRMVLSVAEVNAAFAGLGDARALDVPEEGPETDNFIELYTTLPSIPAIGRALLLEREYDTMRDWAGEGDHVLMLMGLGRYSFKGSGYVRGGIFDRIQLIQGDMAIRFRDRDHRRVGDLTVAGAPRFREQDMFRIPADSGFDPAQPWRLQLLVGRDVGALERVYTTFESGWQPPAHLLRDLPAPPAAKAPAPLAIEENENAAMTALWQRIWRDKTPEITGLGVMLLVLTGAFFFQTYATVSERAFYWFRMGFLTVTLVFLGWYANAQLSVVNIMALAASLKEGFTWSAFLLDPLTFILWFSIAASLIFWGRGAYCGWLCPFGALQELTNQIARRFRVPQWTLPWGLHERLWAVKYILFLGLFGVSLASIEQAEHLAEVEPFKTAIVLKFDRAWPFVLYALVLLGAGLFVERFYCRYLCPLGGALAIPARMRMFDWLRRYRECGNPCQTCANECFVQAIHPTGEINPNECLNCLHCQVLYQSKDRCPVVIKTLKRRATAAKGAAGLDRVLTNHPNQPNLEKGKTNV